jgi:predicted DNA-binding transcriptional regulator YafY
MTRPKVSRRRPAVHITLGRASRLHRLVRLLDERPRTRDEVLSALGIGLRTFYRELELLKRCSVKIRHKDKSYVLQTTTQEAEGRLPFPDPQLSFAEMAELARHPGEAALRLSQMLDSVVNPLPPKKRGGRGHRESKQKRTGAE